MKKEPIRSFIAITAMAIICILAGSLLFLAGSLFFSKDRAPVGNADPETKSYIAEGMQAGVDRCNVHGTILEEDKVRIVYGLMAYNREYEEAKARLFPNAFTEVSGGCVVQKPKYAKVLYCQQCRIAEEEFKKNGR